MDFWIILPTSLRTQNPVRSSLIPSSMILKSGVLGAILAMAKVSYNKTYQVKN